MDDLEEVWHSVSCAVFPITEEHLCGSITCCLSAYKGWAIGLLRTLLVSSVHDRWINGKLTGCADIPPGELIHRPPLNSIVPFLILLSTWLGWLYHHDPKGNGSIVTPYLQGESIQRMPLLRAKQVGDVREVSKSPRTITRLLSRYWKFGILNLADLMKTNKT